MFKEDKDLAGLMAATASVYEAAGPIAGADRKAAAAADNRRAINFADKWGRVELARVCAAAVYADWTSTQDFVKGVGSSFWKMLGLLATRCANACQAPALWVFGAVWAGRRNIPGTLATLSMDQSSWSFLSQCLRIKT